MPGHENSGWSMAGIAARFLHWRLDGCLLAATPSELILIIRGSGIARIARSKGYRYEAIYIPETSFQGAFIAARSLASGASVHSLRLSAMGHRYELAFSREPSEALSALGS